MKTCPAIESACLMMLSPELGEYDVANFTASDDRTCRDRRERAFHPVGVGEIVQRRSEARLIDVDEFEERLGVERWIDPVRAAMNVRDQDAATSKEAVDVI